ncbi:MAG TPA: glycosyltransferase family A protein [Acidimicrobiales bacterium]|nr:glycosyltransferase family A protein [Acidimicrobiales bacterium]
MTDPALPTVDVIIDNYNYARFLPDAIESALAQTHPGTRVIVVDDGSTDESRAVIAGYGSRVTPVLKHNGGQASALNAGFAQSEGDLVIFLDADDTLRPATARSIAAAAAADAAIAKFQYRLDVLDASGRRTGVVKPPDHLPLPRGDVAHQELVQPFDLTWMPTSGNAFPRWVLEQLLPMPESEFARSADWYLQHLPPLFGPVASFEWVGGGYRVHDSNSYETSGGRLDLNHVRQSVTYAAATRRELLRIADQLDLEHPREILSVADLANRLVSRRLAPSEHPIPSDRVPRIVLNGWRATARRMDVAFAMKAMFAVWFLAVAIAPRRISTRLAEGFLFPERRLRLNRALGRLHRPHQAPR